MYYKILRLNKVGYWETLECGPGDGLAAMEHWSVWGLSGAVKLVRVSATVQEFIKWSHGFVVGGASCRQS